MMEKDSERPSQVQVAIGRKKVDIRFEYPTSRVYDVPVRKPSKTVRYQKKAGADSGLGNESKSSPEEEEAPKKDEVPVTEPIVIASEANTSVQVEVQAITSPPSGNVPKGSSGPKGTPGGPSTLAKIPSGVKVMVGDACKVSMMELECHDSFPELHVGLPPLKEKRRQSARVNKNVPPDK
ncbi:hypothetical protein LINPERPRIM_LOCUS21617 [Linum perenne]